MHEVEDRFEIIASPVSLDEGRKYPQVYAFGVLA